MAEQAAECVMDAQQGLVEESECRVNPTSDADHIRHLIEYTREEFANTIAARNDSLYEALYRSLQGLDEALKHPDIFDGIADAKYAHGRDTAARYLDLITRDDKGQSVLNRDRRSQYACAIMWMVTPALSGVDLETLDNSDEVIAKARSLGGIDGSKDELGEVDPDRPGIAHLYRQHRDGDRLRDKDTGKSTTATPPATPPAPKFIARIGAHRIDVNSLGEAARQQIVDALAGSDIEVPEFVPSKSSETSERRAPRGPNDTVYTTNPRLPAALIKHVSQYVVEGGQWLDPFRGHGAFYDAMPDGSDYCEIAEGRDFFDWKKPVACIASNPAWSDSEPNSYSRLARHAFKIADVVLLVTKATVTCTYARWADWEAAGHGLREIIHLRWEDAGFEFPDGTAKAPEGLILAAHIWVRGYTGDPHINRTWLQGIPGENKPEGACRPGDDDSAGEDPPAAGEELAPSDAAKGDTDTDQRLLAIQQGWLRADQEVPYQWWFRGWKNDTEIEAEGYTWTSEEGLREIWSRLYPRRKFNRGRVEKTLNAECEWFVLEIDEWENEPDYAELWEAARKALASDQRLLAIRQGWLREGHPSPFHWWCRNKDAKEAKEWTGYTWTYEQGLREIWSRLYPGKKFNRDRLGKTLDEDEWFVRSLDDYDGEDAEADFWQEARELLADDTPTSPKEPSTLDTDTDTETDTT